MADQSLQAFQLGASLFDRAQTQQRLMEQFQLQAADQVMRQRQYDLQNKIQNFELGRAMKAQEDELGDADNMNYNVQQVDQFFVNPDAPFPTFKPVKSSRNQAILNQYRQQLDDFSTRRRLMNGAQTTNSIIGNQLAGAIEFANKNGLHDIVWQNNNGLNEYGQIDPTKAKSILDAVTPKMAELTGQKEQLDRASKIGTFARLGKDAVQSMVDSGQIPKELAPQALLAAESFEKSKLPAAAKNTDLFIEATKKKAEAAGRQLSALEEATLKESFLKSGGRLRPLEAKTAQKLEDEFAVIETIDDLKDGIAEFEKRYPGKKFTDFLGAIPATRTRLEALIQAEKDPMKKEALGLLADFSGVINQTARTTSGLNVTQGEGKRITQEIGGVYDKNSLIKLDQYRDRIEKRTRGTINRNLDRALPAFAERWASTPFGTRTTAVYSVPTAIVPSAPESMSDQDLINMLQQLQQKSAQQ